MKIIFSNNKEFEYLDAFSLEKDNHKGVTRPSLEIYAPINVISYSELDELLNSASNLKEITLIGDTPTSGEILVTPMDVYYDYDIKGKITVDDEVITFKLYKKSDLELENEEAIATIDTLLMALEG